jgi:tryptophanyl-tRNA synthetase
MLANAHSFKDKSDRLSDVNAGLFTYPVLMSADIILYQADLVPVGKDQVQHLEIARDIASVFNNRYGHTFTLPEAMVDNRVMIVPGIDGKKMSKSYQNTIDIFLPEKQLDKVIKSIITDSTPIELPKNPDTCTVFALYSLLATSDDVAQMRNKYLSGGFGYGHAKKALFEIILSKFTKEREQYMLLMNDLPQLEKLLTEGEEKTAEVAMKTLLEVRLKLGYA